MSRKRKFLRLGIGLLVLLAGIQLVPYGRAHDNPAVIKEPTWDRPRTRELAVRACFDCHSNETVWPWYSHVAPISWLVQRDVDEGREEMNFSEWNRSFHEAHEAGKLVRKKKMPLGIYLVTHPEGRLTDAEREELAKGLEATVGSGGEGDHDDDDDD